MFLWPSIVHGTKIDASFYLAVCNKNATSSHCCLQMFIWHTKETNAIRYLALIDSHLGNHDSILSTIPKVKENVITTTQL